eukprot:TRINITY_DN36132_c0_g1_i1.p1 TRINITY_DN36132_c0_g1~~TRINITY_DN36132_c0_g1_i1.p1  ORF type:complete len:101 (-),score=0.55 TRINITY_DN36132_c0_g1_i1:247-549(-)
MAGAVSWGTEEVKAAGVGRQWAQPLVAPCLRSLLVNVNQWSGSAYKLLPPGVGWSFLDLLFVSSCWSYNRVSVNILLFCTFTSTASAGAHLTFSDIPLKH